MWPVYEIRPPDKYFFGEVFRYADGQWIPDDGEWDLAFAGHAGSPTCLMVDLPYHENIIWSWTTGHWSGFELRHPRGNAWHYMLREGAQGWGNTWARDGHANIIAGRSGMNFVCRKNGCANGVHAELCDGNFIINAGLMRNRETREVVKRPEKPMCMYCDNNISQPQ